MIACPKCHHEFMPPRRARKDVGPKIQTLGIGEVSAGQLCAACDRRLEIGATCYARDSMPIVFCAACFGARPAVAPREYRCELFIRHDHVSGVHVSGVQHVRSVVV